MNIPLVSLSAQIVHTFAFASLVVVFLALFPKLDSPWKLSKIPQFGNPKHGEMQHNFFLQHAADIYREGYKKASNPLVIAKLTTDKLTVYQFRASHPVRWRNRGRSGTPKFLPELRKYPDDFLSNRAAIKKAGPPVAWK